MTDPPDQPGPTGIGHTLKILAAIERPKPNPAEQARRALHDSISIWLSGAALAVSGASLALAFYLSTKVQPVALMLQGPAGP